MERLSRRHLVRATGAALVAAGLAGCTGNGGDDADDDGSDDDRLGSFLSDASGFDGQIQDFTGEDRVTVMNGAGSGGLAFDPAGIRIDAGTTVVWEWTGNGGRHNVASTSDSDVQFSSDLTDEAGHTYEYTFDEPGIATYVCEPHRGQRMKGGVEIV